MKIKKKTLNYCVMAIIFLILLTIVIIKIDDNPEINADIVKCIGENSKLYVQTGCGACQVQEDLFGNNYELLDITDCIYEREACTNAQISVTPTWIIGGQSYEGVQQLDRLQEITDC